VWARTGEDEWAVGITVVEWFTPTSWESGGVKAVV